jgi:chromosome transmission fidelity protein 8
MSEVAIHPPDSTQMVASPLPQVLQTPGGNALLEIQGQVNTPGISSAIQIGHLEFPDYDSTNPDDTKWMKKVYLYVGKHQRMRGEVKKLLKALAILKRKTSNSISTSVVGLNSEELEIAEIVKFKIVFSERPEPVGTMGE